MENKERHLMKRIREVKEIDLGRIFKGILKKAWLIAIVAVLCAILSLVSTIYCITPWYQSSVMFYVNNTSKDQGLTSTQTYADITAAKSLVDTYLVILNTRTTIEQVIEKAKLDYSYGQVKGMISAAGVNDTEVFKVVVTSEDPEEAAKIAYAIKEVLPTRIKEVVSGTAAYVVDAPATPTAKSGPSYSRNTIVGLMVGLALSVGAIALVEIMDNTIKTSEDVENCCAYPILATVPEMSGSDKGKNKNTGANSATLVGDKVNFAAAEAYKLLRTKLLYAFSDDKKCHVFMVSSAMAGEGKSLTSVNIAYNMSQLNKRTLLIDCDLRQPTIAEKIKLAKNPGLADYLAGCAELKDVICQGSPDTTGIGLDVIVAGNNPPNPIELLSSDKMARMIETLRESYDYIVLDLPPVGEVSDALVASRLVDGTILVTRQNYCNHYALKDTISQLEFIDAKILGAVINCTASLSGKYGYNYKYSRYSKYYRRSSGYGYGKKTTETQQEVG